MRPIHFNAANLVLVKPESMNDEQCAPLSAYRDVDADGKAYILTMWQPNYEDIQAINRGEPIIMKTFSTIFPPVSLFTCNENNEANL